ncbi:hypothetical protein C8J57DRAFT_1253295 [Mycena rebaudengoi]|nr:hypothetical protein C8J57DRAFT_1253295 [Mycena rebaudengoi]
MRMHTLEQDGRPRRLFSFKDSSEGRLCVPERKHEWSGGTLGARAAGGRSLREGTNLERADDAATLGLGLEERTAPSSRVGVTCASLATPVRKGLPRCSNSAWERNAGMKGAAVCSRANRDWIRKTLRASMRECVGGPQRRRHVLGNGGRLTEHAASQLYHGSQHQRIPQARASELERGRDQCAHAEPGGIWQPHRPLVRRTRANRTRSTATTRTYTCGSGSMFLLCTRHAEPDTAYTQIEAWRSRIFGWRVHHLHRFDPGNAGSCTGRDIEYRAGRDSDTRWPSGN